MGHANFNPNNIRSCKMTFLSDQYSEGQFWFEDNAK